MEAKRIADLEAIAKEIRTLTIDEIGFLGVGHIGGAMSVVELLVLLYNEHLKVDPKEPRKADRDRFILSKGHACPVLYAALARRGYFSPDILSTLRTLGSPLQGHPDMNKTPGVDMTAGSLGHGIGIGQAVVWSERGQEFPGLVGHDGHRAWPHPAPRRGPIARPQR